MLVINSKIKKLKYLNHGKQNQFLKLQKVRDAPDAVDLSMLLNKCWHVVVHITKNASSATTVERDLTRATVARATTRKSTARSATTGSGD
jgi:hypothetical protein